MRIFVAQINPTIGDLNGNKNKIIASIQKAKKEQASIVLFCELALTGYPPEDLLFLPNFMEEVEKNLHTILLETEGIAVVLGTPRQSCSSSGRKIYNSAAILHNQQIVDYVDKILLPTYDVFDERRFFTPGEAVKTWSFQGENIGITICEDAWKGSGLLPESVHYERDPINELQSLHPTCVLNLTASPFSLGKFPDRLKVFQNLSKTLKCPVVTCCQVGANDSLIFDGYSLFIHQEKLIKCGKGFQEDAFVAELSEHTPEHFLESSVIENLYQALVLGLKDYFRKSGLTKACLGLSGGIDSAVVAALAVEALGASNVLGLMMPSRYSSPGSLSDAQLLAERLGIETKELSIEGPFKSYLSLLHPFFEGHSTELTEENLQARIRGMLLMAFSNTFGYIVLSTGNKSELAMGYSTLYGDMCGGISPLGDVKKQQVYALADWINREKEIIPFNTIQKPPSAELRLNQKDSDSLPDYAIIDDIILNYVENNQTLEATAKNVGVSQELVSELIRKIHFNEYKRRQSPLSFRISDKSFSVGRKFPIVQLWVS